MKHLLIAFSFSTLILGGCAHRPEPVEISSAAGPTAEIAIQRDLLAKAKTNHLDVLAPKSYDKATEYYFKAIEKEKDDEKAEEIYEALGYSKAYLKEAKQRAAETRPLLTQIIPAREAALEAGAAADKKSFNKVDEELISFTEDMDDLKKMEFKEKESIQGKYLALELTAIKNAKLAKLRETLQMARAQGAGTLTPNAYAIANEKYLKAETVIETDRHSSFKIDAAVSDAQKSADQVYNLVTTAQKATKQTPEQLALTLQARDREIRDANELSNAALKTAMVKDDMLDAQGQTLAKVSSENRNLRQQEEADQMVEDAAAQFDKSEAEVYRQNGKLVIRLKKMNFSSGQSAIPSKSVPVLTKVKEVLKELGPGAVMIEGHTDAVGSAELNKKLSKQRAQAVAQYLEADTGLAGNEFETAGRGFSKPLTTNKTKEGRAQNRRVDIIITPSQSI